jgi:16S rRNA (guanine966-N2)-methyltransferase
LRKPPAKFPPVARTASRSAANCVRIIAGRWRGRKITFSDVVGLRPTGDRIRETLFNWLMPVLPGAHCLDLFAGSGVLGFEALSRGARACVLVESNPVVARHLQTTAQSLEATDALVACADARTALQRVSGTFNIVFIDPPFADKSIDATGLVAELLAQQRLAENAWVYVEQPCSDVAPMFPGFTQHRAQRAGSVAFGLWCRNGK